MTSSPPRAAPVVSLPASLLLIPPSVRYVTQVALSQGQWCTGCFSDFFTFQITRTTLSDSISTASLFPSGEKAMSSIEALSKSSLTSDPWIDKKGREAGMFHSFTSVDPMVATKDGLPAENLTHRGQLPNFGRVACSVPVRGSQKRIVASSDAEARSRPSFENAHDRTQSLCPSITSEVLVSTFGAQLSHGNVVCRRLLRSSPRLGQNKRLFFGETWGGLWVNA